MKSRRIKRQSLVRTALHMGTTVRLEIVTSLPLDKANRACDRAFDRFRMVEQACSRFDPTSELMQLVQRPGEWVQVSEVLFQALFFACEVAEATQGAFDPTVGALLARAGFDRHYLTGERVTAPETIGDDVTYHDIAFRKEHSQILLEKPMHIDLGAVAKGLAIDLAARELSPFEGSVVNAGGDLYVAGTDVTGKPWQVGIQHPAHPDEVIQVLHLTNRAVCTSGSYERRSPIRPGMHHIVDPRTQSSPSQLLSCTAVGPFAMLADAFSTAAFVLGPSAGLSLLEQVGLEGMMIADSLDITMTPQMKRYVHGQTR